MFGWFNSNNRYRVMEHSSETANLPDDCYRVGVTPDGSTTLTLQGESGYSTITLTMNKKAVLQLIRMLEASIDEETY